MRSTNNRDVRPQFMAESDPRQASGAEIIDLRSRNLMPAVSHSGSRSDGWGTAAGIAIVAALGAITLSSMNSARTAQPAVPQPEPLTASNPAVGLSPFKPGVAPQPVMMPPPGTALIAPQSPAIAAAPQPIVAQAPAPNRFASPSVVFDASAMPPSTLSPGPGTVTASGPAGDDFASRIGGVGGGAATARAMVDPKTTVTQGTFIPAVLETAINTDVPGYARAVVSADVRSFDGSRVLIPRSSRLIGQYKSGLQAGQKRAYVIWTRLIRPDGVSVNIASPATAFSGETGLAGSVDSHFFARFGSALLLSVVGGLSTLGGGGASAVIAGGGQSAAAAAIGQNGQIGPTVRVRQGEPIRVFIARDLDFSKVSTE